MPKTKRLEQVTLLAVSALGVVAGAMPPRPTPSFAGTALIILGALVFGHTAWRVVRSPRRERVFILGSGRLARRLIDAITARPELGWYVVSSTEVMDDTAGARAIRACRPDRIVVALDECRGRLPVRALLAEKARGVPVEQAGAVYERVTGKIAMDSLRPSELLFGDGFRVARLHPVLSRLVSIVAAAVGLLLTAVLFPLIALAIKLDSAGPVFFRQARLGLRGKPFPLIKFRTMRPTEHPRSEWERDNADRLTPLGRWLRRFRLDELPQLWNILRGDMNLVGPRPHPVTNRELFARNIPYYELRTLVRPGLTGWAQVHYGYANGLEEETEKMCYDLYYLKHRSLWLDLCVLPATLRVALAGSGGGETAETVEPEPAIIRQSGRHP